MNAKVTTIKDGINLTVQAMDSRQRNYRNSCTSSWVSSSINSLDEVIIGFQRGDLIVVAGRPSMGKSVFAANIAVNAAVEFGQSVGWLCFENSIERTIEKMLSLAGDVDIKQIGSGKLSFEDWRRLNCGIKSLSESEIYFKDGSNVTVDDLYSTVIEMDDKARVDRLRSDDMYDEAFANKAVGLDLLIVDNLQLLQGKNNDRESMDSAVKILKSLAKKLDIPVIAMYQLHYELDYRPCKRPKLADLTSQSIELYADMVLGLYRDAFYQRIFTEGQEPIEISVLKNKNGAEGKVIALFDTQYLRISDEGTDIKEIY